MSHPLLDSLLRKTANRFGLDITRYHPERSAPGRLVTTLKHHEINLVLDVGANIGQFAKSIRGAGYVGRITSFEPLLKAHASLVESSLNDPLWNIAPRMAIGDHEGEVAINVSGNSVSSSVLEMLDQHADAAPDSRYVSREQVRVARLDSILIDDLRNDVIVPFLKVDTQGYEAPVLDGAPRVLAKCRGLQLELSFVPLYDGQQLFDPLLERMKTLGFSVWGIWPGFCDKGSGRMLQVDVVLFRD